MNTWKVIIHILLFLAALVVFFVGLNLGLQDDSPVDRLVDSFIVGGFVMGVAVVIAALNLALVILALVGGSAVVTVLRIITYVLLLFVVAVVLGNGLFIGLQVNPAAANILIPAGLATGILTVVLIVLYARK